VVTAFEGADCGESLRAPSKATPPSLGIVKAAFDVVQPLVLDWKVPFGTRLLARAGGESGSKSRTNSAAAPAGLLTSRERLSIDPCFIASSPGAMPQPVVANI
jgi:hypothetical protein